MHALVKPTPQAGADWPKGLELIDVPTPKLQSPREVRLNVVATGVCGTDVSIYQSQSALAQQMQVVQAPHVTIGHEFCGVLAEAGTEAVRHLAALALQRPFINERVTAFLTGKTEDDLARDPAFLDLLKTEFYMTAEMHVTCGTCLQCSIGQRHLCQHTQVQGMHRDGTYAESVVVPAENLVIFAKGEISPDIIAFMDAIGNGVHLTQAADVVGRSLLVTGAGIQGAVAVALGKLLGAYPIFCTDTIPMKLDTAQRLGADFVFNMSEPNAQENLQKTIHDHTDGNGVDVAFEVSGKYPAYSDMFNNVRLGGSVVLLGLPSGAYPLDFSKIVIFRGLTIIGVYGRRVFDSWHLMEELLSQGLAETLLDNGIITHRLPLERYEEGFQALEQGKAIKVLLYPNGLPSST